MRKLHCGAPAIKGSERMVRFLLEHGANPSLEESVLGTPLDIARRHAADNPESQGYRKIIGLLDETMARQVSEALAHKQFRRPDFHPNIVDFYSYGRIKEAMDAIREDRSLLTFRDDSGGTLCELCCLSRGQRHHRRTAGHGCECRYGRSAVHSAADMCHCVGGLSITFEIMELLLQNGASINRVSHSDCSAISYAMMLKEPEIIEFLLKHGADINILTPANKQRILGSAVAFGDEQMVRRTGPWCGSPSGIRRVWNAVGSRPGICRKKRRPPENC